MGIELNFSKQWSEDDIFVDGNISLDFDSSRTVNTYRPSSLILSVYRNHFNAQWNFFTDLSITTNQDLFSSRNDDEDLTIVGSVYFGAGLNLWRGDLRGEFLDLQLGIGPRYEYDFIDLELRERV